MATGILSTDPHLTGDETLSLTALAGLVWIEPAVGFVRRLVMDPHRWAAKAVRLRLCYDEDRWATAFPLGMTAAALSVATAVGVPWLRGPGRVPEWVSVAVWLLVAAGMVVDAVRTARAEAAQGR
ncbi:hypothetical protein ABZ599_19910 [Streptomyces misionensis]|uniref:hypothetical protein n=1 Tax=Streptomyces misionensis TaxID=67331 RepID=UPI0033FDD9F2